MNKQKLAHISILHFKIQMPFWQYSRLPVPCTIGKVPRSFETHHPCGVSNNSGSQGRSSWKQFYATEFLKEFDLISSKQADIFWQKKFSQYSFFWFLLVMTGSINPSNKKFIVANQINRKYFIHFLSDHLPEKDQKQCVRVPVSILHFSHRGEESALNLWQR